MSLDLSGVAKDALLDEAKINDGVWVHLDSPDRDPETGAPIPMYARKPDGSQDLSRPQRALVRSHRCKAVKEAETKRQKTGMVKFRLAKKKERDDVIAESTILPKDMYFSLVLVALDNFGKAGGRQDLDADAAKQLYAMSDYDHIVQQITETSYDDEPYKAGPGTDAGNGSESSTSVTTTPKETTTEAANPS